MFVEVKDKFKGKHYLLNTDKIVFLDIERKYIAVHHLSGRIELTDDDFDKLIKILKETSNA